MFGFRLHSKILKVLKIQGVLVITRTPRQRFLNRIVRWKANSADETNANIRDSWPMWVLTSRRDVVYILTESREGEPVSKLLKGFRACWYDFYAAYDSID